MSISAPPDLDDWPSEILDAAKALMNGVISIYDPSDMSAPIIKSRAARIQQIRRPLEHHTVDQFQTTRHIRFQIELKDDDPEIGKGYVVRVEDGGNDGTLESYAYQVTSAINSSHAAVRTIETTSELAPVPAVA